jgi:hypothetical protein
MHDQPWSDGCLPGWGGAADSLLMLMLDLWSVVCGPDVIGRCGWEKRKKRGHDNSRRSHDIDHDHLDLQL